MFSDTLILSLKLGLVAVLLTLLFSTADTYFNHSDTANFADMLWINILFILSGIVVMSVLFILSIVFESAVIKFIPSDEVLIGIILLISAVIIYFIKFALIDMYGIVFNHRNTILLCELAIMGAMPFTVYRFLEKLGKAFMH